jgi:hypothetical protein
MPDTQLLTDAITNKKCVSATYNGVEMILAPHALYTKHDATFVDAITLTRDGQPPREKKLGSFNISGLKSLALTAQDFDTDRLFDRTLAKYVAVTLCMVERATFRSAQ